MIEYKQGELLKISRNGKTTIGEVPYSKGGRVEDGMIFIAYEENLRLVPFKIVDAENRVCEEVVRHVPNHLLKSRSNMERAASEIKTFGRVSANIFIEMNDYIYEMNDYIYELEEYIKELE